MAVRINTPQTINGVDYPGGLLAVGLDPREEEQLVQGGGAARVNLPPVSGYGNDGKAAAPSIADLSNARRAPGARAISLPTPYPLVGPTMVHASWAFREDGWNGYPHWMAVTPYPNNDSTYENPCILASLDGDNWGVPPGLNGGAGNPVIPFSGIVNKYNRDSHLIFDPTDSTRQIMIYLTRDTAVTAKNYLYVTTSRDGWKTFTPPVAIWFGAIGPGTGANQGDMAAPSIWYDKVAAKWVILAHNLDAAAHPYPLRKITSSDLFSGWDTTPVAVTFPAPYSGRDWWHSHWGYDDATGNVFGLVQDNANASGNPGNIYLAWSSDGANTFSSKPIDLSGNWYRPTFCVRRNRDGSQFMDCIFSSLLNTVQYRVAIQLDANLFAISPSVTDFQAAIAGYNPGGQILLADNCTRADNAAAPGSPNIGGAYAVQTGGSYTGGAFGISSNRLYGVSTSAGNKMLTPALGLNYRFTARFVVIGTQAWINFRSKDKDNTFRFGFNATSTYRLQKIVAAGIDATFGDRALGPAPAAGDLVEIECSGTTCRIKVNGVFVVEFDDAGFFTDGSGVYCGLQSNGAVQTYFDTLLVKKL